MKLATLILALSTLAAATSTSAPFSSDTNLRINNAAQRPAITKSRITSSLARSIPESIDEDHTALYRLSNAIRDAIVRPIEVKSGSRKRGRQAARAAQGDAARKTALTEKSELERRTGEGKVRRRAGRSSEKKKEGHGWEGQVLAKRE